MRTLDDAGTRLVTHMSKLFDIVRSFLEAMEGFRVVLDPELRAALLEVCFHGRAAGQRLFLDSPHPQELWRRSALPHSAINRPQSGLAQSWAASTPEPGGREYDPEWI